MPTKTVAPTVLSAYVLSLSVVNLQLFGNSTALALVVQKKLFRVSWWIAQTAKIAAETHCLRSSYRENQNPLSHRESFVYKGFRSFLHHQAAPAQNPNNLQVLFREYDSTLNYDCAQGTCQFVTRGFEVAQQVLC